MKKGLCQGQGPTATGGGRAGWDPRGACEDARAALTCRVQQGQGPGHRQRGRLHPWLLLGAARGWLSRCDSDSDGPGAARWLKALPPERRLLSLRVCPLPSHLLSAPFSVLSSLPSYPAPSLPLSHPPSFPLSPPTPSTPSISPTPVSLLSPSLPPPPRPQPSASSSFLSNQTLQLGRQERETGPGWSTLWISGLCAHPWGQEK